MKPSQLARSLKRIASGIESSKNPKKELVIRDLKRILAAVTKNGNDAASLLFWEALDELPGKHVSDNSYLNILNKIKEIAKKSNIDAKVIADAELRAKEICPTKPSDLITSPEAGYAIWENLDSSFENMNFVMFHFRDGILWRTMGEDSDGFSPQDAEQVDKNEADSMALGNFIDCGPL